MDPTQAAAFVDFVIGFRSVGVAGDEEIIAPNAPEARAFVVARVGGNTPRHSYEMKCSEAYSGAMAAFFREVADAIDAARQVEAARKLPF